MDTHLKSFDDEPVMAIGIEIPGAAGGLRDALEFDPIELRRGEEVYVVLRCTVDRFHHVPIKTKPKDGGEFVGWRRVHVLDTDEATFIDADVVTGAFQEQAERIAAAKAERERAEQAQREREAGLMAIPGTESAEQLQAAHDAGEHAGGLVAGCPGCDEETAAEATEKKGRKAK